MRLSLALALAVLAWPTASVAQVTVGMFAPTAPFPSTSARVDLASRLGDHVGRALGRTGSGKVFARSGDFVAAVKKGEIDVALVDAAYLAVAGGSPTVIAAAVRDGETSHGWQLVSRVGGGLGALRGKRLLVPGIGSREQDFVLHVLLGGELARDYFSRIEIAPDTVSAIAALGLGKTDAVMVPAGIPLPSGAVAVLSLPPVPGPVLVVYGDAVGQRDAIAAAALTFRGDATVSGLRAAGDDDVRRVARRLVVAAKRGTFVVPTIRLIVDELLEGRTFSIEQTPVTSFTLAPAPSAALERRDEPARPERPASDGRTRRPGDGRGDRLRP